MASIRFIDGEPLNAATKMLSGSLNSFIGLSTCCRIPPLITATRSAIVMASTWSWVT